MQQLGGCCVIKGRMLAALAGSGGGRIAGNVASGPVFGPVLAFDQVEKWTNTCKRQLWRYNAGGFIREANLCLHSCPI